MHLGIFLSHFTSLTSRPDHECIHGSLDPLGSSVRRCTLAIGVVCGGVGCSIVVIVRVIIVSTTIIVVIGTWYVSLWR